MLNSQHDGKWREGDVHLVTNRFDKDYFGGVDTTLRYVVQTDSAERVCVVVVGNVCRVYLYT